LKEKKMGKSFTEQMEYNLSLFQQVHGRKPKDSNEFSEWCDNVEQNSKIVESKGGNILNLINKDITIIK
jgi:hypothetical protein